MYHCKKHFLRKALGLYLLSLVSIFSLLHGQNLNTGVIGDSKEGKVAILTHDGSAVPAISNGSATTLGGELLDITTSPDNKTIFAIDKSGAIKMINPGQAAAPSVPGGKILVCSPDGRSLFVASDDKVHHIKLFDSGEKAYSLPATASGSIRAMDIRPDGESLFVTTEGNETPPSLQFFRMFIPNDSVPSQTTEKSAKDPTKEKEPTEPYFDKENVLELSAPGEVSNISGMAISPDGNFALITAKGISRSRSTNFGILPEPDDNSGGIFVVDLNSMTQIDFFTTNLLGENTAAIRKAVELEGAKVKHPLVEFYELLAGASETSREVLRSVGPAGDLAAGFNEADVINNQYLNLYRDIYADWGLMRAYDSMYPTDMIGANSVAISNRGDLAVVPMLRTNNVGFIPLNLSDSLRGYGVGNRPRFGFSSATDKAINSIDGQGTDPDSNKSINLPRANQDLRTSWMAPTDAAFSADDSMALLGMNGGRPTLGSERQLGAIDVLNHRDIIFAGSDSSLGAGVSSGIIKRFISDHKRPTLAAGFHPIDTDGDTLSDHTEAFNRFNDLKDVRFGDRSQLASTNRFNITDPTEVPRIQIFPADETQNSFLLPHSGLGYRFNYQGHSKFATNAASKVAISTIEKVGRLWHEAYRQGAVSRPYFVVLNMSHPGGGLVYNEKREKIHFTVRDGYQANFAYLKAEGDDSIDFVKSNIPSDPLNNKEGVKDADTSLTKTLINFFVAEDSVEKVIIDPAVAVTANSKIEVHGVADPKSRIRRDHDNYFRVIFKQSTGDGYINVDNSITIPGSSEPIIVLDDPASTEKIPYALAVTNDEIAYVQIGGSDISLTKDGPALDLAQFIPVNQLPSIVWGNPGSLSSLTFYGSSTDDSGVPDDEISSIALNAQTISLELSVSGVPVNGNENSSGIPKFADGFNLDGKRGKSTGNPTGDRVPDEWDDESLQTSGFDISIGGSYQIESDAAIRLEYEASYPSAIGRSTQQLKLPNSTFAQYYKTVFQLPSQGALRMWKNETTLENEHFRGPGIYELSDLGLSTAGGTLRIDSVVEAGASPITVSVDPDGLDGPAGFIVSKTIYANGSETSELAVDGGNTVLVSNMDFDSNGILDFAEFDKQLGFEIPSISLPSGGGKVAIDYSASDPKGVNLVDGIQLLPAGHLRLWKSTNRAKDDYVAPGIYDRADIGNQLFVEAVVPSASQEDQRITVQVIHETKEEGEVELGGEGPGQTYVKKITPAFSESFTADFTAIDSLWEPLFAPDAKFRKFDIVGQPIRDRLPQGVPELDVKKNGFYVDAYSLTPVYSTVDFRVPLHGGNSFMEFRRTASIDSFLSAESGSVPIDPVGGDQLLGPGWRTNIGARVVYRDGIFYVHDENGQNHRYSKSGQPLPQSFQMMSTHHSDLQINADITNPDLIDSVIWTRNFHTTYFFEKYKPDPDDFKPRPIFGQLLRLKYMKDGNGNGVAFVYESDEKSYPTEIYEVGFQAGMWVPDPELSFTDKKISFTYTTSADAGIRLETFKDPKNNEYKFSYGSGSLKQLLAVDAPVFGGRASESYAYETKSTDGLGSSNTKVHHTAIKSVTNRNGNAVTLTYTTKNVPVSPPNSTLGTLKLASITTPAAAGSASKTATFSETSSSADQVKVKITAFDNANSELTFNLGSLQSSQSLGGGLAINNYTIPYLKNFERTTEGYTWKNTFSNDTRCNLLQHKDQNDTIRTFEYPTGGRPNEFDYSRYNRPKNSVFAGLIRSEFIYDFSSRRLVDEKKPRYFDGDRTSLFSTSRVLDDINRNVKSISSAISDPDSEDAGAVKPVTTDIKRNDLGFPTNITDFDARTFVIDRQKGGGWSDEFTLTSTDGNTYTQKLTYDLNGNLTTEEVGGFTTRHTYDAANNRTLTTYPGNREVHMKYDALGQLKELKDPIDTVTKYEYDARENVKSVSVVATETLKTEYEYNAAGLVTKITYPEGNTTVNSYDKHNRLTQTTSSASPSPEVETVFDYTDKKGSGFFASDVWLPNKIKDPIGTETVIGYDPAYRLLSKAITGQNGASRTENYITDSHGNITQSTIAYSGGVQTINTVYDHADRPIQQTITGDGVSIVTKSKYDARGNLVKTVDGDGFATDMKYDFHNNLLSSTLSMGDTGDDIKAEYQYDLRGLLKKETLHRKNGNIVTDHNYTDAGFLEETIESNRRTTTYTHNKNGMVLSATISGDSRTVSTGYKYDGFNRLTEITLPNVVDGEGSGTGTIVNTYDKNSNLKTQTDARGTVTTYTYDEYNRVRKTAITGTGVNISTEVTYDGNGNILTAKSPRDFTTTNTYDGFNRLYDSTDAVGNKTSLRYDSLFLTQVTEPKGGVYQYTTDAAGRVTGESQPENWNITRTYNNRGLLLTETKPLGGTYRYEYDGAGRVTKYTSPIDASMDIEYDQLGNVTKQSDFMENSTRHEYDLLNRRTDTYDRGNFHTVFEYDITDNLTKVTDPNNGIASFIYDGLNRQISATQRGANGSILSEYTYNGQLTKITDENGHTRIFTYDGLGRQLTAKDGEGFTTTYTYDPSSNLETVTDPLGRVTFNEYDAIERLSKTTEDNGGLKKSTSFFYDENSNRRLIIDANGFNTTFTHDKLNRTTSHTFPTGESYSFVYDASVNKITTTTPNGETIVKIFDNLDRLTEKSYKDSGNTVAEVYTNTYDANSNFTGSSLAHPSLGNWSGSYTFQGTDKRDVMEATASTYSGSTRNMSYEYDSNAVLKKATSFGGRELDYGTNSNDLFTSISTDFASSSFSYDEAFRPKTKNYVNGVNRTYSYDKRNLLLGMQTVQGSTNVHTHEYAYDNVGMRTFEKNSFSNTGGTLPQADIYEYDSLYRVVGTKYGVDSPGTPPDYGSATTLNWEALELDKLHNRKTKTTSDGTTLTYNPAGGGYKPDELNRITGITDGIVPDAEIETTQESAPDRNEIQTITISGQPLGGELGLLFGEENATFPLEASPLEIKTALELLPNFATGDVLVTRFEDADNQFIAIEFTGTLATFDVPLLALDPTGLLPAALDPIAYDKNGNMLNSPDGTKTYVWNAENRLASVSYLFDNAGTLETHSYEYVYSVDGLRLAKIFKINTVEQDRTYYYYDGAQVCLETDGSGAIKREYLLGVGIDAPIAMIEGSNVYYFHQNSIGNVIALTDSNGDVVQRYDYDIHGNFEVLNPEGVIIGRENRISPYLFTGRRYDEETRLYYYRNRYYSPELGRFLSTDPLDYVDGMNTYAYGMGNVVNGTDPMGTVWDPDSGLWGFGEWGSFFSFMNEEQKGMSTRLVDNTGDAMQQSVYMTADSMVILSGDGRTPLISETFKSAEAGERPNILGGYVDAQTIVNTTNTVTLNIGPIVSGIKEGDKTAVQDALLMDAMILAGSKGGPQIKSRKTILRERQSTELRAKLEANRQALNSGNYDRFEARNQLRNNLTENRKSLNSGNYAKFEARNRIIDSDLARKRADDIWFNGPWNLRVGTKPGPGERALTKTQYKHLMSRYRNRGEELQATLDNLIANKPYVYRATDLRMVDIYRKNGKISGRSGGTYMTTDPFSLNPSTLMDIGQVFKHWGTPEVLIRIPATELKSAIVPRPLGNTLSVGWEPFTQFYPAAGRGTMRQFLGETKSWDDSWVIPLNKKQ